MLMLFVAENIKPSRKGVEGNFEKRVNCVKRVTYHKKTITGADAPIPPDTISPPPPTGHPRRIRKLKLKNVEKFLPRCASQNLMVLLTSHPFGIRCLGEALRLGGLIFLYFFYCRVDSHILV
jgi:hypothetical protein